MTERRIILEMLRHSSLVLLSTLGYDHRQMRVEVTIGVQHPEQVDCAAVAAILPRGRAEVKAVHGGLNVHDPDNNTTHVIAAAAVAAFLPIEAGAWRLSSPSQ